MVNICIGLALLYLIKTATRKKVRASGLGGIIFLFAIAYGLGTVVIMIFKLFKVTL